MGDRWIKLYEKIDKSSIYKDSEMVHLWVHLLIKATKFPYNVNWGGDEITLNPGELITGRKKLSADLKINESKIQRSLKFFEKCHMIEQRTNRQSRIVTVLNWDNYQTSEQRVNNERTTSEQRVNTNKKERKKKEELNNSPKSENKFSDESLEMKIAKYLFSVLLKSDPNNKKPNFQSWSSEIDKILRIDKRNKDDIRKVIDYAHDPINETDKFSWIPNLRSPNKLREHFTTIFLNCSGVTQDDGKAQAQRRAQKTAEKFKL